MDATPSKTETVFRALGDKSNVDANTITTLAKISAVIMQSNNRLSRDVPSCGCMISNILLRKFSFESSYGI